jgi:hypothetical protein
LWLLKRNRFGVAGEGVKEVNRDPGEKDPGFTEKNFGRLLIFFACCFLRTNLRRDAIVGLLWNGIIIENQGEIGARRETEMPRARQFAPLLFLFLAAVAAFFCTQTAAQELKPTGLSQWDSTNQVLFFANCGAGSVVRAYVDGRQRGADIDISKDFPGIQECYVDSLTAGPDGTTVIAALLNFGKNCDVREMILTYDSSGKLLTTWDPAPQYVEAIAYSKDDDAVFILGGRDLPDGPYARNYPLLVEYSRDGRVVLKVMFPAGALKDGGDSFHQGGEVGQLRSGSRKTRSISTLH